MKPELIKKHLDWITKNDTVEQIEKDSKIKGTFFHALYQLLDEYAHLNETKSIQSVEPTKPEPTKPNDNQKDDEGDFFLYLAVV